MQTLQDIKKIIDENMAVMLYFSTPKCNVCQSFKPKLLQALESNFKEFKIVSIDISISQEVAAHFSVLSIPTVLIFLDSKEFLRKSRYMSVKEVISEIKRPYFICL
ncbi:MAG: thioredoxin family protein [Sulfurimonas sp.]|nr:thioredoxin family protein [Sulfurimonas sp.]